jgi:hypothetical protein
LAETILKASAILSIFFLPALAFVVESKISITDYILLIIASFTLTLLVSIIIIFKFNSVQKFYQLLFDKFNNNSIPIAMFKTLFFKKTDFSGKDCEEFSFKLTVFKKTLFSFVAYIFIISGYFAAFMLAILYPDNRLTLSQFATIFHGFGVVMIAFYLDPMLSRSIDSYGDDISWVNNVYSILLGRMLSYLIVTILLSFFLLFRLL